MNPIETYIDEIVRLTYGEPVRSPDALRVADVLGIECRQILRPSSSAQSSQTPSHVMSSKNTDPGGRWVIYLDLSARPERRQFDVAHEILEQFILEHPESFEAVEVDIESLTPDGRLELAHQLASYFTKDLLLNPDFFRRDFEKSGEDLTALKRLYPNASHEVIAYAMLPLMEGAILTILDAPAGTEPLVYRRLRADTPSFPHPMTPPERTAAEQCFAGGQPVEETKVVRIEEWNFEGAITLRAWPVFEPNWRRVFLFTLAEA